MDDNKPRSVGSGIGPGAPAPITEADQHAYADRQLSGQRVGWLVREVQEWAESRPVSNLPPPPNTGAPKRKEAA